ncbi:MAG: hypothetical protein ACR2HP_10430, partial [Ilumatobacteraceae bacterium]
FDLGRGRPLVDAPFAAQLELEVLDGVGRVHVLALDAGVTQATPQHPAGRSDERVALVVLLITRLLADQHQSGLAGAFAEHGAGGVLVQRAPGAIGGGGSQLIDGGGGRDERGGGHRRVTAGGHGGPVPKTARGQATDHRVAWVVSMLVTDSSDQAAEAPDPDAPGNYVDDETADEVPEPNEPA